MKLLLLTGYSQLDRHNIWHSNNQYDITAANFVFTATLRNFTLVFPFLKMYSEIIP